MGPSLAGNVGVPRARANRASSCQVILLHEGEDVWSCFQAPEANSHVAVPTEPEAARTLLGPMESLILGKRCDPEQRLIRAEVCSPSTVSLCRMQLLEARFVQFRKYAVSGTLPSWLWAGC